MQIKISLLGMLVGLAVLCCAVESEPTAAGEAPGSENPSIRKAAKSAEGFVPKGWHILFDATGDLNGDRLPDSAMVLAKDGEEEHNAEAKDDPYPRCLVIALRGKDGLLHKSFESWSFVPCGMDPGPLGGDLLADFKIVEGKVVIDEFDSGSYTEFGTSYSIARVRQQWRIVAAAQFSVDKHNDPSAKVFPSEDRVDYNLVNGYVQINHDPTIVSSDDPPAKPTRKPTFDCYYALRATFLPSANESPSVLQALPLSLNQKKCIVRGAKNWAGPTDLSAVLQATCSEKELILVANVKDDVVSNEDEVRIVDENGHTLKPVSQKRIASPGGYIQTNHYSRSQLKFEVPDKLHDRWCRAAVQITDCDKPGVIHCAMSTAIKNSRKTSIATVCDPLPDPGSVTDFKDVELLPWNND